MHTKEEWTDGSYIAEVGAELSRVVVEDQASLVHDGELEVREPWDGENQTWGGTMRRGGTGLCTGINPVPLTRTVHMHAGCTAVRFDKRVMSPSLHVVETEYVLTSA